MSKEEERRYFDRGAEIVKASYHTLRMHLVEKIEKEGIGNAIKYCNTKAYPLMDSISNKYGVEIRRTSLKARNPKNKPLDYEDDVLMEYHETHRKGEMLIPKLKKFTDSSVVFYVPILLDNPICLNCHGPKKIMVTKPNERIINSLYPTDEATGYNMGDLRGMWTIRFKKEK